MSGSTMLLVGGLAAIFIGLVLAVSLFTVGHRVSPVERGIATIGQAYSPIPQPGEGGVRQVPAPAMGGTVGGFARALTPRTTAGWIQRRLDYAGNPPNWP